jgi:uncharacterized protein (TIGR02145 family)
MSKSAFFIVLIFGSSVSYSQNMSVTFTGTGAATQIDSVTATNLTTNLSVTLPGNETLVLTVNTGVPSVYELINLGIVFPNPFSGRATVTTIVQQPQSVYLKVQNLAGQIVAQTKTFVQPGENKFALSVTTAGIYMVSLTTGQGTAGYKVICTETTTPENSIQYLGSESDNQNNQTNHNNHNNPSPSSLKSSHTGYNLGYTSGDIIHYTCKSGFFTTIITDKPNSSKNYDVEFVACTDADGKNYSIVKIGTQTWMDENLAYLPSVSPSSADSVISHYYYVYGYEGLFVSDAKATVNYITYGVLYNWEAAKTACPSGWHLPSDAEWTALSDYLGTPAGGKMKETGTSLWTIPNMGATNESGFRALPGGYRDNNGGFSSLGYIATFWSSSENGSPYAWYRFLYYLHDGVTRFSYYRSFGFSARCLQN